MTQLRVVPVVVAKSIRMVIGAAKRRSSSCAVFIGLWRWGDHRPVIMKRTE